MNATIWPLAEVLSLAPAWGGDTWQEAVEFALADPLDTEMIEVLAGYLTGRGGFREPIRVDTDEDGNDYIGNGMHRIITHALCGVDQVLVTREQSDLGHLWRVKFIVVPETAELVLDLAFGLSQPVDDDHWIEQIGAGIMDGIAEVDLCTSAELEPGYVAGVVATFYTKHGFLLTVEETEVESVVWDENEGFVAG